MDKVSKEQRSRNMSQIRSRNTRPELLVRSALRRRKVRFSTTSQDLPGKPDLVLPEHRLVMFIHGCFWHQHPGCPRCFTPKSRLEYWVPKLRRNVTRFQAQRRQLNRLGWHVSVIWECDAKDPKKL